MVAVPAATPVTIPVPLMIATLVLPLLHTPPVVSLLNVVVAVAHSTVVPVIVPALGIAFTVIICEVAVVLQLLVTEYEIVAVPAVIPVTNPVLSTEATEILSLVHVPPVTALLNVVVAFSFIVVVPVIVPAEASGLIVTIIVTIEMQPLLFTE